MDLTDEILIGTLTGLIAGGAYSFSQGKIIDGLVVVAIMILAVRIAGLCGLFSRVLNNRKKEEEENGKR